MHCSVRGKGEAVLLVHGMPTNGRLWDGVVRDLSRNFRCFIIDLPGMGGTRALPYGAAYFAQVAEQIEQIRTRYQVQRWHVVGHDGGCAIAVQYAHLFRKRVGCMALLSPAIFPDLRPFFLLDLLRKPVIGELLAPLVHACFWQIAMKRAIPELENAAQRCSFQKTFSGPVGPWKLMRLVRWGEPESVFKEFPSILREIDCPTLVVHGSRDILPESFAARGAELIPNSHLIELDSGHFIPIECAVEVAENLAAYFRSRGMETGVRRGTSHRRKTATPTARPELVPVPAAH
ncbi:alpha/beta fold hydrolase [Occallatibacter savannae]|uniref:alpha/beta fold hydrolase n=1 Tax=Occallatibacter savannae TaxID=1002691 RepID=UPI000D6976AA|nr:alpha/beta hydrolase [Occallatibacter savannae]